MRCVKNIHQCKYNTFIVIENFKIAEHYYYNDITITDKNKKPRFQLIIGKQNAFFL